MIFMIEIIKHLLYSYEKGVYTIMDAIKNVINRYDVQCMINRSEKVIRFYYGIGLDNGYEIMMCKDSGYIIFMGDVIMGSEDIGALGEFLIRDGGIIGRVFSELRRYYSNTDIGIGVRCNGEKYVLIRDLSNGDMISKLVKLYRGEVVRDSIESCIRLWVKDFEKFLNVLYLVGG